MPWHDATKHGETTQVYGLKFIREQGTNDLLLCCLAVFVNLGKGKVRMKLAQQQ